MVLDRRTFLGRSAALAGRAIAGTTALNTLNARAAWAASETPGSIAEGYGPLSRKRARNTGEELLALPRGFSYVVFGVSGSTMSDGNPTPIACDGMAAFSGSDGLVRLIRNHEVRTQPGDPTGRVEGPDETRYDLKGVGGTTTLDFDNRRSRLVRDFVSLNGTIVNCAGGIMLEDFGWVTCEETVAGPNEGWDEKHGYCFVVPVVGPEPGSPATAMPIPPMGRFSHEAVAVDPSTGYVYETEDQSGTANGLYRYRPNDPANLADGGVLEMLKITGRNNYDTREGQTVGSRLPVEWATIDDPDPDLEGGADSCTAQGIAKGGAKFNRLEGCWYGNGSIFFNSTSGGDAKNGDPPNNDGFLEGYGQVWRYLPSASGGALELIYESPGGNELDSPDNLTVTPRGGVMICEDDASDDDSDTHPLAPGIGNVNRLIGLALDGAPFEFAVNIDNDAEFAGATFSRDGSTLFVNSFGDPRATDPPGRTFAITGPWKRGPL